MKLKYPDYEEIQRYSEGQKVDVTSETELVRDLKAMGVEGRHVMVHASFRCLRPVERGPQGVVDAFVLAVGPKGRLLFPTYDFRQWSEDHYWDRQESPSRMGAITEAARNDSRFIRTRHPMLSYALYDEGWERTPPSSSLFLHDWQHSHGPGSIFDRFTENDGLLVSIGALSGVNPGVNKGFTFIHHAEVSAGVEYRRNKDFGGIYVNHGDAEIKKYTASVCHPSFRTMATPAMQAMEDEGVISNIALGRSRTHVGSARNVYGWVQEAAKERPELLREVLPSAR